MRAGKATARLRALVSMVATTAVFMVFGATSASAGTLDQSQEVNDSGYVSEIDPNIPIEAQTITPGITGLLDQVDLVLSAGDYQPTPSCSTPLRVWIESVTAAGVPSGQVLASASVTSAQVSFDQRWIPVTYSGGSPSATAPTSSSPASVTSGQQFAIVLSQPGGNFCFRWALENGNPYPRGMAFQQFPADAPLAPTPGGSPSWDNVFRTYVKPVSCQGETATQLGTAGRDVIKGTRGSDVIAALGGRDTVSGLGGNDVICGGAGKDALVGGDGKDTLLGQGGKDSVKGGGAKDLCIGGKGNDSATCEVEKSL